MEISKNIWSAHSAIGTTRVCAGEQPVHVLHAVSWGIVPEAATPIAAAVPPTILVALPAVLASAAVVPQH